MTKATVDLLVITAKPFAHVIDGDMHRLLAMQERILMLCLTHSKNVYVLIQPNVYPLIMYCLSISVGVTSLHLPAGLGLSSRLLGLSPFIQYV